MSNIEQQRSGDCNGGSATMSNDEVRTESVHCSWTITKLAKAMLKVQKAIGPAVKDKKNDFTKSSYATLNSVMDSCLDVLTDAGIWVTQYPVAYDGGQSSKGLVLALVTKLVHAESGEWQSSLLVMPLSKNDPQGYGSAMTYARRYGLSAMVGIVTEDDDANMACNRGSKGVVHNAFNQGIQPSQSIATRANNQPIVHSQQQLPNNAQLADSPCRDLPVSAQVPVNSQPVGNQQTNGNNQRGINNQPDGCLPKIDGVNYNQLVGKNGAAYVIATGNTRGKSPILKEAGFSWDASGKKWWKYAS